MKITRALVAIAFVGAALTLASSTRAELDRSIEQTDYPLYINEDVGFSLSYPSHLDVTHHKEPAGYQTIMFMDSVSSGYFTIFLTPYSEVGISGAVLHDAGGKWEQGEELSTIMLTRGGGMSDFWFAKNGRLYQINTFEQDEAWLVEILKTWRFMQ